jgi:hypothetical protein
MPNQEIGNTLFCRDRPALWEVSEVMGKGISEGRTIVKFFLPLQ